MPKKFNILGACNPDEHYMVNLESRLARIKNRVDEKQYFTINRGRQYGKTTTLKALERYLGTDYIVIRLDFQGNMSAEEFENQYEFSTAFAEAVKQALKRTKHYAELKEQLKEIDKKIDKFGERFRLIRLFSLLSDLCAAAPKPIVLMIDEADQAANNQVFLDFLGQLRYYYMERDSLPIFQSVILAGVYDIRNLKLKIRGEEEHKQNSPWNIAEQFDLKMNFSAEEIAEMLMEYESDHQTGMNIQEMAQLIYDDTSGYPVLVSSFCKLIDENLGAVWTKESFLQAERILLTEKTPLFESLMNKLKQNEVLKNLVLQILFIGKDIPYNADNDAIDMAAMYGFVANQNGKLVIFNRIFETRIYNWLISIEMTNGSELSAFSAGDKSQFIKPDGRLDMEKILEKFVIHFDAIYGNEKEKFKEEVGRRLFLLYLRPIINGTGFYYIELQTRNDRRMDVVVSYAREQHVVELKIWHGEQYNEDGEQQLSDYLDYLHLKKGYLLTFNFNKEKEVGIKHVTYKDKKLIEAMV